MRLLVTIAVGVPLIWQGPTTADARSLLDELGE